jgi:hypothetical protein
MRTWASWSCSRRPDRTPNLSEKMIMSILCEKTNWLPRDVEPAVGTAVMWSSKMAPVAASKKQKARHDYEGTVESFIPRIIYRDD